MALAMQLRKELLKTYNPPKITVPGLNLDYKKDNKVSMVRVNDYILAIKLAAPRIPLQRRFLTQYGFVILSKNRQRALLLDILMYPANEIVSILQQLLQVEIAGILLSHRHVAFLSSEQDITQTLSGIGYPERAALYLHASEHEHKESHLFKYRNDRIRYQDIMTCTELQREFDFELMQAGCHTQGSVLIYHRASHTLLTGDLAMANTQKHALLTEATPFYLSDDYVALSEFWKRFDSDGKYKDVRYFVATHGEPIDLQREKVSLQTILKPLRENIAFFDGDEKKEKMLRKFIDTQIRSKM